MAFVFTTQITDKDVSRAEVWGEIIQMPMDTYRDSLPMTVRFDRLELIRQCLEGNNPFQHAFDPFKDYILAVGDPINIGLVFAGIEADVIQVLRWDKKTEAYTTVTVPLRER